MAQWDTGVLDRNQEEARNITIDEILASAMPSALYRATRRRSSSAFSDYNITYEFPGCDSMARITGFTVTLDQAGNEPLISKLNPICSENFVMRSGFLSTQASIVSYTCADGYFFNKYIIYASMGTNNQVCTVVIAVSL
jgi:hypothetical protein